MNDPVFKFVSVKSLRYTQDSITDTFKDGSPIQGLVDVLVGAKKDNNDPNGIFASRNSWMSVVQERGKLWTLSNRRLWCLRTAGVESSIGVWLYCDPTNVKRQLERKRTTLNDGIAPIVVPNGIRVGSVTLQKRTGSHEFPNGISGPTSNTQVPVCSAAASAGATSGGTGSCRSESSSSTKIVVTDTQCKQEAAMMKSIADVIVDFLASQKGQAATLTNVGQNLKAQSVVIPTGIAKTLSAFIKLQPDRFRLMNGGTAGSSAPVTVRLIRAPSPVTLHRCSKNDSSTSSVSQDQKNRKKKLIARIEQFMMTQPSGSCMLSVIGDHLHKTGDTAYLGGMKLQDFMKQSMPRITFTRSGVTTVLVHMQKPGSNKKMVPQADTREMETASEKCNATSRKKRISSIHSLSSCDMPAAVSIVDSGMPSKADLSELDLCPVLVFLKFVSEQPGETCTLTLVRQHFSTAKPSGVEQWGVTGKFSKWAKQNVPTIELRTEGISTLHVRVSVAKGTVIQYLRCRGGFAAIKVVRAYVRHFLPGFEEAGNGRTFQRWLHQNMSLDVERYGCMLHGAQTAMIRLRVDEDPEGRAPRDAGAFAGTVGSEVVRDETAGSGEDSLYPTSTTTASADGKMHAPARVRDFVQTTDNDSETAQICKALTKQNQHEKSQTRQLLAGEAGEDGGVARSSSVKSGIPDKSLLPQGKSILGFLAKKLCC